MDVQIAEVKEYLEMVDETSPEDDAEDEATTLDIPGPVLLFGNTLSSTKSNLLAALPTRSLADRLVSAYLNSHESPLGRKLIPNTVSHFTTLTRESFDTRSYILKRSQFTNFVIFTQFIY